MNLTDISSFLPDSNSRVRNRTETASAATVFLSRTEKGIDALIGQCAKLRELPVTVAIAAKSEEDA
jgi:hypothetical protein